MGGAGRIRRVAAATPLLLALTALPFDRLTAQVGNDPSRSPFQDVTTRQGIAFTGGWFMGNHARAHVGAHAGPAVRMQIRTALSGPIDLSLNIAYIQSQRYTINTTLPANVRMQGPIDYNLIAGDLSIGVNLTGAKTWHGLAPYISVGMGIIGPTETVVDPGGYKAGSGFTIAPAIGLRARLGSHLGLMFEAKDNTIRYEWPLRYFDPIDLQGNPITPPVLSNTTDKQTTHNLTLSAGLTYHFNF